MSTKLDKAVTYNEDLPPIMNLEIRDQVRSRDELKLLYFN